jgi:hypothetical protein
MSVAETMKVVVFGANLEKEVELPSCMRVLEEGEAVPDQCPLVFRIIDQKDGDKRIVWDSNDFSEIVDAKAMFDKLIEEGMIPYRVDPSGKRTPEVMTQFDPVAEEVVLTDKEEKPRREVVFTPGKALAGG